MVPWKVYSQCRSDKTVSSEMAQDPTQNPEKVFHRLFEGHHLGSNKEDEDWKGKDDLQKAAECGQWGAAEPSRLFLEIYRDALSTLEKHPMAGVVSPPLMGSRGVVPLTIVAPLPDLCRHLANCFARAEKEVFLATNFWIHSDASTLVTNSFRELSKRAGERGEKVVVKVLYDRGDPRQVLENHLEVDVKTYVSEKVQLPAPEEIPNIDLQVVNYHRPVFGTFHTKFVVVDRRVALLQSSNIQDNDNLEMLIHVEGPIVDSFYDTALISWGKPLEPPLPMLNSPASAAPMPTTMEDVEDVTETPSQMLPEHTTTDPHYDPSIQLEALRMNDVVKPRDGESRTHAVTRHLNTTIQPSTTGDAPDEDQVNQMKPYVLLPPHEPFPMALVNRAPYGAPNHSNVHTPQNAAFLAAINNAEHSIFIQTPNMNAEPLLEPLLGAVRRGVTVTCYLCLGYNDAGELLPFQNGTNEMISHRLYTSLETDEERARLRIHNYVGKDQTHPIHNHFKRRSCHIKLMIIDEKVAIQGNGNLDTQSYFHSQEANLLIDSPTVCRAWLEAVNRNQNTAKYGLVSPKDGCWHDPVTGELPEGSIGIDPGSISISIPMMEYDPPIREITQYVFHHEIPPSDTAWPAARTALLDALGCAIETAHSSAEGVALLGPVVEGSSTPHGFRVPGTRIVLDPVRGAFNLGVLIRYLDHNDALGGMEWGHPSDNLGAILAVMDWLDRSTHARTISHTGPPLTMHTLLLALIKAYEIQGCYQLKNAFNAFGLDHVVLVKLASAAVVAWLLGLSEEQTNATISHVWMDGQPTRVYRSAGNTIPRKGWAAGDACMRAVHLALLVRKGQPGAPGALSSVPFGFYARTFGATRGFEFARPFGTWTIRNVLFKVMPVEGHAIAAVEAALVQRRKLDHLGCTPAQIARIEIRTTAAADLIINKRGRLRNAADRDHCLQYVVALALLKGAVPEVRDYADGSPWVTSAELDALRGKMVVRVDEHLTRDYLDLGKKSIGSAVTVRLQDGSILEEVLVQYPVGHVKNPATAGMVDEKFKKNMRLMFSEAEIAHVVRATKDDTFKIMDFVDLLVRPASASPRL
ncbi:hypothetical protein ASPZODRAFT_151760 [Penicilliopsis zonata CBS 506.65]|uniref:PLD phosphodiesterase domain-containing protein n=1 Tax=Penicilliopsis zonata CBS 506.65 TaxID=1073090 RepID=A0A1L9SJ97_9EURO|nr:hypothetical protein ASPZODRAFT_151760 [Penicilliopsis zonata CBS 506.65]OJJ47235.1 hypothetical protein ASPZODRAFT_151760 [Penicilliopsis zonata CBS 506.65]